MTEERMTRERERFEKWCRDQLPTILFPTFAWEVWQAAYQARAGEVDAKVQIAIDNLLAETAPISGDYKTWECQVCGETGNPSLESIKHLGDCVWKQGVAASAALRGGK